RTITARVFADRRRSARWRRPPGPRPLPARTTAGQRRTQHVRLSGTTHRPFLPPRVGRFDAEPACVLSGPAGVDGAPLAGREVELMEEAAVLELDPRPRPVDEVAQPPKRRTLVLAQAKDALLVVVQQVWIGGVGPERRRPLEF